MALGKGGATETVVHGETGFLFTEENSQSLTDALRSFENSRFDPARAVANARRFSRRQFRLACQQFLLGLKIPMG